MATNFHRNKLSNSRRNFSTSTAALCALPLFPFPFNLPTILSDTMKPTDIPPTPIVNNGKSIIGDYGQWAAGLAQNPPMLSFRNGAFTTVEMWREVAKAKTLELIAAPNAVSATGTTVTASYNYDGLAFEELQWQLPYGRPTKAILVKPANAKGPLPGVLALHDHSGMKYFGALKNCKTSDDQHQLMAEHQKNYYSGRAWVNELAKRGYVVLIHDVFSFGSRRVLYQDVSGIDWGVCATTGKLEAIDGDVTSIDAYNEWSSNHEHILSKSLFCAGTTWPGVSLAEDMAALDVLSARTDVDANNLGCCGLSGGGLRTDYLGGLDHRIKCAISVGFMTTWNDFLLNKSFTHTWMIYAPLLAKYLDFPEILAMRAPLPTMVLNSTEDHLFTLPEMKKADAMLKAIYKKAGASKQYASKFYAGDHKFDLPMQEGSIGLIGG